MPELPVEGYYQRVDPHSATSTMAGFMYETAKWATWRNPYFLSRVGRAGWDAAAVQTPGMLGKMQASLYRGLNEVLAPNANAAYEEVTKMAASRAGLAKSKALHSAVSPRKGLVRAARYQHLSTEAGSKAAEATVKRHGGAVARMLGEPGMNARERAAMAVADKAFKGKFGEVLGSKSAGIATKHAALAYGAGAVFRRLNAALWIYDIGRLGMAGAKMVADVGARQRFLPTHQFGSGVQDSYMAQTMRQSALMDMYSSEYGNRRMIGNEARFLHT